MDIFTDMQVMLFCKNVNRLPKSLRLYNKPNDVIYEVLHRTGSAIGSGRFLWLDSRIIDLRTKQCLTSPQALSQSLNGIVLPKNNPASLSRVVFLSENGNLIFELSPDGKIKNRLQHKGGST